MHDKPKETPSLGLELTPRNLLGAELEFQGRTPKLVKTFSIEVDRAESNGFHVKLLYMRKEEKDLKRLAEESLIVTSIPSKDVLIRPLEVQLTKERDIDAVIEFQTEPLLPYPVDEAVIDRLTFQKEPDKTKLTIASVKSEQVAAHLERWHSLNIEPEVISCGPAALKAFASQFFPTENPLIILHIGPQETACILLEEGRLTAAQTLLSGVDEWIDHFSQDVQSSFEEASERVRELEFDAIAESEYPLFHSDLQEFLLQTTRITFAFGKQVQGKPLNDILVTGEGGTISCIIEALKSRLHQNVTIPESQESFNASPEELQRFALPIGMALTALPLTKEQINFRQKNFVYPHPWKRLKKPIGTYLASCILLAFALYTFGNAYIASRETKVVKKYLDLLAFIKKPYEDVEEKVTGKPLPPDFVQGEVTVSSLSQQQIMQRISYLMKEVRSTPDVFPLYPNVPRVSDVLAWLSTNPHIVGADADKLDKNNRIQLESFNYKLVKRPEQNKMREKYQAKVDLEFSTQTPRYAREFHDYLLSPNDFVDPKGDVKWSSERGRYRASFFLKDKTLYPTAR